MILFILLLVAAGITAFYMFRLIFMTFTGEPRDAHAYAHAKESPAVMWVPLVLLALLSIGSGYENRGFGGFFKTMVVPYGQQTSQVHHVSGDTASGMGAAYAAEEHPATSAESPETETSSTRADVHEEAHHGAHHLAMTLSVLTAFSGIILAAFTYWERIRVIDPAKCARAMGPLYDLVYNKYYVDEFYAKTFYRGLEIARNSLARFDLGIIDGFVNWTARATTSVSANTGRFDNGVIDGLVNWVADVCQDWGERVRRLESGIIQNYVLKMGGAVGLIVVVWIVVRSLLQGA